MFDLFSLTFNLQNGAEQPTLPGFLMVSAPKRVDRSREGHLLALLLTLSEESELAAEDQQTILKKAAEAYFSSSRSMTAGLRSAAEVVNALLLKYDLHVPEGKDKTGAMLNMAVLHKDTCTLVHAGPTHSRLLNISRSEDYVDPVGNGVGLGVQLEFSLGYFQFQPQRDDLLIFCPRPTPAFHSNLLEGSPRASMNVLYRRLLEEPGKNFQFVILQFQPGKGDLHVMRARFPYKAGRQPASEEALPIPGEGMEKSSEELPDSAGLNAPVEPASLSTGQNAVGPDISDSANRPLRRRRRRSILDFFPKPASPAASGSEKVQERVETLAAPAAPAPQPAPVPVSAAVEKPDSSSEAAVSPSLPERRPSVSLRAPLAAAWRGMRAFQERTQQSFKTMITRVLPGAIDQVPKLPTSTLLFVAIAVPLAVAAMATTVYWRNGAGKQFELYYQQAQKYYKQSGKTSDKNDRHLLLEKTITALKNAEVYQTSSDAQALLAQAQETLDVLDHVTRLDLQPIQNVLDPSVVVTQIAANQVEIYLLDGTKGRILRLYRTDQGFVYDPEFNCSPGRLGSVNIGPILDLVVLPVNSQGKATVMGVDSAGNLLYCVPGGKPFSKTLTVPETAGGWGKITSLDLYEEILYVLDTAKKSIYYYVGDAGVFADAPHLFFNQDIPPDISDGMDMSMIGQDMYLLHRKGTVARCTFRTYSFSPTRFVYPAPYLDYDGNPTDYVSHTFTQIQTTQPPDPSVYFLDTKESAVYRMGLGLTFDRKLMLNEYSSEYRPPRSDATAFTISSGRTIIMAFGNEVFYGQVP